MIQEVNRIINSIGDYNTTITSRDIPISRRKELLALPDRSNNDTILLTVALAKFNINNKLNIFNENWNVLLGVLDQLAIIQYSILYYINPEYIVNITDGSELIDILPIEEVLAIGEYCDSIVENGINSLSNYNNSIHHTIVDSQSALLNELIESRETLSDSDVESHSGIAGENPIQANYKQYLGIFSIIYLNMFKMIEKYMEPYNELNDFNSLTSYFIAVSSYAITNSIPTYVESYSSISKRYNNRVGRLYRTYIDASVYTLNNTPSHSDTLYDNKYRIMMYEFKGNNVSETNCSSNVTFDEYAFFAVLGLSIYSGINLKSALAYLSGYKVRVFARIKESRNGFDIVFESELYSDDNDISVNSSVCHRIVITDIERTDQTLNDIENAILHEIAYNFPKYAHVINRVAVTLNENYEHKLIDGIYKDSDKTSKVSMLEYSENRIDSAYISLSDIPNINDVYKRANHQSERSNSFFERFVNN